MKLSKSNSNHFIITDYFVVEGNGLENFYGVLGNEKYACIGWKPKDQNEMGLILHNYGTIKSIQLNIDYNFSLSGVYGHTVGGLVCYNESGGVIDDCSVTMIKGSFNFTSTVGGLVGYNYGTIKNCWATVNVETSGTFGVIVGVNYGTVTESVGMGNITQKVTKYEGCYELSKVGGIAGINAKNGEIIGEIINSVGGTIDDSYLSGVIDVSYVDDESLAPYSGPIAGENNGEIIDCSNYGYAIDTGNLHSWWAWFHTYDQLRNINNTI